MCIARSLAIAMVVLVAFAAKANAFPKSESFVVPAGQEKYVGDVPIFGEACFKVTGKDVVGPARAHFRGLINGKPIDLDRHFGGRCLKFTRDGGIGNYRVYVIAEDGIDLIVVRTVNEKPTGGSWDYPKSRTLR